MGLSKAQKISEIDTKAKSIGLPSYTEISSILLDFLDGEDASSIHSNAGYDVFKCNEILKIKNALLNDCDIKDAWLKY